MSERSYNLRPRAKTRFQSETRPSFGHEPSTPTGRTESPTTLTGEKRPAPGQHPVPEVVGIAPRSEMRFRPVLSLAHQDQDSTPAGERVLSLESVDAGSGSVVHSSSDIVVTEVAVAGASLIEFGLPTTVASSPSQSAVDKQTGETPAVSDRSSAIEEDLWRPALDIESRPVIHKSVAIHALDLPTSPDKHWPHATMTDIDRQMHARPEPYYSLPACSDVDKHGPRARPFMTDVDRQTADRPDTYFDSASAYSSPLPDVYTSLTTRSYEYTSMSASHARPTVSLGPHVDEA